VAIVTVLNDEEALAEAAAERVTSLIEASIPARGSAVVCLSGGRTPRRLYALLADASRPWRARIEWTRVHVYWSDERHVPPDHPESNFGMAHRGLLAHVPIPANQVHRIPGELPDAAAAAREYERILPETFDIMLLGLGEDAHIASIFPGSPLLKMGSDPMYYGGAGFSRPGGDRAAAVWVEHLKAWRITLTPAALRGARAILVIVSGENKAAAVRAALDGPMDVTCVPAQLLRAAGGHVEWIMDAAAARLRGAPPG
jgi:6-phosphogluconolactonase